MRQKETNASRLNVSASELEIWNYAKENPLLASRLQLFGLLNCNFIHAQSNTFNKLYPLNPLLSTTFTSIEIDVLLPLTLPFIRTICPTLVLKKLRSSSFPVILIRLLWRPIIINLKCYIKNANIFG